MEIRELTTLISKHKSILIISILVGIILGNLYYLIPKKYVAIGSLYVTRKSEETQEHYFNYEGYYSQQAALAYTNTIVALLESYDIRDKSLKKLNIPITEESLRKYGKMIKVKKAGPQLITLTIKEKTPENAKNLWETIANTTIQESKNMNKLGDASLNIEKISDNIVIKKEFDSVLVDVGLGALLCFGVSLFVIIFKEMYFKKL